jgi:hypothetical protein
MIIFITMIYLIILSFILYLLRLMRKLLQLWILSVALIASLLLLFINTTNASETNGNIALIINTWMSSCVYGTSLYLGDHTGQYSAFALTGTFSPSTFSCVDLDGLDSWSMTLLASTDLNNWLQTISKQNVFVQADINMVTSWFCTTWLNTTVFTSIWTTPWTILHKSAAKWDICEISANNVQLSVVIPANQAVGLYTWTLLLTSPR